jgi:S1-C subfamily serine protease
MRYLLSILVLFSLVSVDLHAQSHVRVTRSTELRSEQSPSSQALVMVPGGASVRVLEFSGNYYKVEYGNRIGYIHYVYIQGGMQAKDNQSSARQSQTSPRGSNASPRWNIESLTNHWGRNGIDAIEGVYEEISSNGSSKVNLAVLKTTVGYSLIYLSGAPSRYSHMWTAGDIKAELSLTATQGLFRPKWYTFDKRILDNGLISFKQGYFSVSWIGTGEEEMYLKTYPTAAIGGNSSDASPRTKSSGTGFAISSNGFIVTNHHVIEGASQLRIRGVNGDFRNTFTARIVAQDPRNDLAILRIDDNRFTNLGVVPFTLNTNQAGVGESIFVLGYPLRASMGDEIKLTNGIVSSRTGYQGDITSYQISAAVQPGNSGGPLFDSRGNLIGIVNAKHSGAENASYAIKTSYLKTLIETLPEPIRLQTVNSLAGKSLTQQVTEVKRVIYIVEVN